MKLSKNFKLDEFTFSRTALRLGIDNTPPEEVIENIISITKNILQPLRDDLNKPIIITSGYRSPELNKAIGGVSDSQHIKGEAVDFVCPPYTVDDLFNIIGLEYPYDQLIAENPDKTNGWVHVSYTTKNRHERYRAFESDGKMIYVPVHHINK